MHLIVLMTDVWIIRMWPALLVPPAVRATTKQHEEHDESMISFGSHGIPIGAGRTTFDMFIVYKSKIDSFNLKKLNILGIFEYV